MIRIRIPADVRPLGIAVCCTVILANVGSVKGKIEKFSVGKNFLFWRSEPLTPLSSLALPCTLLHVSKSIAFWNCHPARVSSTVVVMGGCCIELRQFIDEVTKSVEQLTITSIVVLCDNSSVGG